MEFGSLLIVRQLQLVCDSLKQPNVPLHSPPQKYPPYACVTNIVKKFRPGFEPGSPDYASGILGQLNYLNYHNIWNVRAARPLRPNAAFLLDRAPTRVIYYSNDGNFLS